MKQFTALYPWFPSLIVGMLSNQLHDPKDIRTKLDNLSKKEALAIGRSLSSLLNDRREAVAGVDLWVHEYLALVALSEKSPFFIPMAVTMGQRKIEQAPWGLWFQVCLGAFLSVLDVGTDINAIVMFKQQRKDGFANSCIAMVACSVGIQLVIVYFQVKKRGARVIAEELILVVFGLKPAVDVFRVMSGAEPHKDNVMYPQLEMIMCKTIEM